MEVGDVLKVRDEKTDRYYYPKKLRVLYVAGFEKTYLCAVAVGTRLFTQGRVFYFSRDILEKDPKYE